MMHEERKIAKIVEEMIMYFFCMGSEDIHSRICRKDGKARIYIDADVPGGQEDKLESLKKYLSEPKNPGIEDVYWELAGSGEPGETTQLLLVGMMIDHMEMDVSEGRIGLTLEKKLLE